MGGTVKTQSSGVAEAAPPQWFVDLHSQAEIARVHEIESSEKHDRAKVKRLKVRQWRAFMAGRSVPGAKCWPILAPLRVELLSLRTDEEVDEFGDPITVNVLFRITLNNPEGTQLEVPVCISADDAAAPGIFGESDGPDRSPDYLFKAWYALGRFGRLLSETIECGDGDGPTDTPLSRWARPGVCDAEREVIDRTGERQGKIGRNGQSPS